MPRSAFELAGALLSAETTGADPIPGISWPTLGVAGGAIVFALSMLGFLIRREASNYWTTTAKAKADLDRADTMHARELAAKDAVITAQGTTIGEQRETITELTTTLRASVDANKANDRAWEALTARYGASPPQRGDTGAVEVKPQ